MNILPPPPAQLHDEGERQNKECSYKIVWLSFFCSLLVLIRHAVNYDIYSVGGVWLYVQKFISQITDVAVPTFFVLSGFLLFKGLDKTTLKRKLVSRIFTLLIPYVIWNILGYFWAFLTTNLPFIAKYMNSPTLSFSFVGLLKELYYCNYSALWFVRNLIVYVPLSCAFIFVLKYKWVGWLPAAALYVLCVLFPIGILDYFCLFLLGGYLGKRFPDFILRFQCKKGYLLYGCIALFLIINAASTLWNKTLPYALYYPITFIEVCALWFSFDVVRWRQPRYWWVHISFFIYCTHSFLLESLEKLFLLLIGKSLFGSIVTFICAPTITLGLIIGVAYLLQRFLPSVWKVLTGGRGELPLKKTTKITETQEVST